MNINYAISLLISAVLSLWVALTAWRRHTARGSSGLALIMLGMAVWSGAYAVRWSVADPAAQFFWLDATYIGVVAMPFAMTVFALQFTARDKYLTRRNLSLLALEPLLTLLLMYTDDYHGLFFGGVHSTGVILSGGPWFWFNVVYSYLVYLLMVGFFFREYRRSSGLYHRQTGTILAGTLLPWMSNLVSFSGMLPFKGLDITPFMFVLSGVLFAVGLLYYRLLDVMPVAQTKLIEILPDGVMVMDNQRRIVEVNPAARQLTAIPRLQIGQPAAAALSFWPELLGVIFSKTETLQEIRGINSAGSDIEVRVMPLFDERRDPNGWLVLLRDITARKQMETRLRDLSTTDGLTNLMNRGFFDEALNTEFYRLKRSGEPLSLIMLDIDHFKKFNDSYGHLAGDECLRKVAAIVRGLVRRKQDVVARYGGEEFMVILPETNLHGAANLANLIQRSVYEMGIPHAAAERFGVVTVSLGVVSALTVSMSTPDKLIQLADEALYRAKQNGRNRIEIAEMGPSPSGNQPEFVRLVWRTSAECGNAVIDQQHKDLIKASNQILSAILEEKSQEQCWLLIEKLVREVGNHFETEEALLIEADFPLVDTHVQLHKELAEKMNRLVEKFGQGESVIGEVFRFLAYEVIACHIFMEDKKYFPYLHGKTT